MQFETTLGRIMGSRGSTQVSPMVCARGVFKHAPGTLIIRGSEVKGGSDALRIAFRCTKLDKKDLFSSDPFLCINRVQPDGTRMKVWESTVIKKDINPVWPPVDISLQVRYTTSSQRRLPLLHRTHQT